MKHRAFSVMGNIAIINFPYNTPKKEKQNFAKEIINKNKSIKTVLEKTGLFKGRLRKQQTKHLAGEKTKEALYKENNCEFRFNVDETYFSPRLANERQEIASLIKKNQEVLVMFAGVAPFSIVIAKNSQAKKVYSNEINRKANYYAKENIRRNKLQEKIELLPGDIKKVTEKISKKSKTIHGNSIPHKFNVIVMPRPQLKDSFLKQAFKLSKKNTQIYYYDFCKIQDKEKIIEKIKQEAKKAKRKIKITKIKHAGEIAPYKIRLRVDFKVLS